jgi:hypothetical protein
MMDFGTDTLVYIIIGVIFVLVQATRKRNIAKENLQAPTKIVKEEEKEELSVFWKELLGTGLTANQANKPVQIDKIPPVFAEPADFLRNDRALKKPVLSKSSFNDPGVRTVAGKKVPASHPDEDLAFKGFDLRSAVVYSVIPERKYI